MDSTFSAQSWRQRQLIEILEGYLADLERGLAPDESALLAANPELAGELQPYLDNLRLLQMATHEIRAAKATPEDAPEKTAKAHVRQIGEYQISREIGRGGMGIVYEAHQPSLNRQVALKILPFAAVLDQRQIARFRNEAQAAAQLHHPHIVPVFAVGQEQGVYYYAMQFIDGQSLEQVITEVRKAGERCGASSTRAAGAKSGATETIPQHLAAVLTSHRSMRDSGFFRTVARLGKEAAQALHHAHEFGVIHRDIKPSNLLLDSQGKLWITDFGLARVQTENPITLTGDVVGTLRYMSPEQAAGRTAQVDCRTDVYSLGVTLYELLALQPAFPGDDRQTLLRQVVDEESIPLRRLNPRVPADLETIVMAAMAKSRDDRYATAQALADDLERYLAGKPTLARRPTMVDRAAKWARRHRPLVTVAACAAVVLCAVSAIGMGLLASAHAHTASALAQAAHNAKNARDSFERAERHFQQARGAVDQFGMRLADRLSEIPGAEAVRRDILLETLGYYREFMSDAGNDPQLRHELALAHFKSGMIAAKLGAVADAVHEYQSAQELFRQLLAADPSAVELQAQLAIARNNLGLLFATHGAAEAARTQYLEAIALQQLLVKQHDANPVYASQLAESQGNLGLLQEQTGETAEAERSLRQAIDVLRPLASTQLDEPQYRRNLAIASNNLSFVLRSSAGPAAASCAHEAIDILQELAKAYPDRSQFQDDLALCCNNLATLESHLGHFEEAIRWHTDAIGLQEKLARKAPDVVRHRSDLAASLNNLGLAESQSNRATEASAAFHRARELLSTLADDYPDEIPFRSSLAALLNNQALGLAGAGRNVEAAEIYQEAIQLQTTCWQQLPNSDSMSGVLSKIYYNYGQSLQAAGQFHEALNAALARRDLWRKNSEHLLGVAAELAELAGQVERRSNAALSATDRQKLADEVVVTLRLAHANGWPREINLASDERFSYFRSNKQFAAFVAELNESPVNSTAQQPPVSQAPRTN